MKVKAIDIPLRFCPIRFIHQEGNQNLHLNTSPQVILQALLMEFLCLIHHQFMNTAFSLNAFRAVFPPAGIEFLQFLGVAFMPDLQETFLFFPLSPIRSSSAYATKERNSITCAIALCYMVLMSLKEHSLLIQQI